jgi:L-fuculose-phosphate aldolase
MNEKLRSDLCLLAQAARVLAAYGHEDLSLGHVAMRDPGGSGIWMKKRGPGLGELADENDFLLVGWDGAVLAGDGRRHSEWPLHSEVLASRPDLMVSAHTHPEYATLLTAMEEDLLPITQDGARMAVPGMVRFNETADLVRTREGGAALAKAMGDASIALLRNHGVSFFAESPEKLALTGVFLERAARSFVRARSTGAPLTAPDPQEVPLILESMTSESFIADNWAFLIRELDRRGS